MTGETNSSSESGGSAQVFAVEGEAVPAYANDSADAKDSAARWRLSLGRFLGAVTIVSLAVGLYLTSRELAQVSGELKRLRQEVGHLDATGPEQVAAARVPSDQPLTYRVRVRVPESPGYRIAYSSLLPQNSRIPNWYGAVRVPPGESLVTVRVARDPRDDRWKITTLVGSERGTQRMATALPPDHVDVFRGSHDVVSTGVGRETLAVDAEQSIRLLDERWLAGEGSLLLYGDRPVERDQLGIYAELQPDRGPL